MSRVDELISELCSAGVAYASVTDVAEYIRGITYRKTDEQVDGPIGVLRANNITLSTHTLNFDDVKRVSKSVRVRENQRLHQGDVLICAGSGSKEHIGKVAYISKDMPETFGGFMGVLRPHKDVEPRFLFRLLTGEAFARYLDSALSTTTINNLNASVMKGFRIPVPPREVQQEIVRILDQFAELEAKLEAELEAELEARRRQYDHCRGSLLTFGDEIPRLPLGDIATIGTGSHDTKDAVLDGDYVFYARGREPLRLDSFDFDESAIITAGDGVGVGKVFHFAVGKYALHQRAYRIVPNEDVDARYIYHWLVGDFARYLERTSVHASVTSLRRPMFLKYPVPVPPLPEQRRVSSILDKFDALVNDLSDSLPAEISARRKQYEYHRDRLLTFEELVA